MKKSPLERQQFKLLPPSEKEYLELSQEEIKTRYKNPESTILQYNNRIKYRIINAIKEIAWIFEKLPEPILRKIFTVEFKEDMTKRSPEEVSNDDETPFSDERIVDVFKITLKAVEVAANRKPVKKKMAFPEEGGKEREITLSTFPKYESISFIEEFMKFILPENELAALTELRKKYFLPTSVLKHIHQLKSSLTSCLNEKEKLTKFIEKEGLKEKYENEDRLSLRRDLKLEGWTEKDIEDLFKDELNY